MHVMLCFMYPGTEGWARDEDVEQLLEFLRKHSMMVHTQADQKRFKLSAMPCLGVLFVSDALM